MSVETSKTSYRLPEGSGWANAWKYAAVAAVLGAIGCALGYLSDPHRFAFSYLYGLATILSLGLGGMFFVVVAHLTKGHWAVSSRRIAELLMVALPILFLFFLPLLGMQGTLYEWTHAAHGDAAAEGEHGEAGAAPAEHGALGQRPAGVALAQDAHGEASAAHAHSPMEEALHHEVLAHKSPFLNSTGWSVRAILYWLVWMLIAIGYFRLSRRQDESKDMALTRRMQWFAPLSMIGFGLTLTFASFDWLMALEPAWYSTIFGVQFFSGAAVTIYAVIILLALGLAKAGHLGKAVNVEHFHDHGKLLFGFVCFWAYISFSQWMLIWYAGIPEEATYYHRRWSGGWEFVSVFLIFGHFVGPFIYGMSRLMKRNLERLKLIAAWMLVMHIVDVYWLVMPYASAEPHLSVNPTDFAALLLMGGAFFLVVFLLMRRIPLVPVGDPRLARSISHVQSH